MEPPAGEWRRHRCTMFSVRWLLLISGLIRVAHCKRYFFCQGSDDYQRLRPEAGARFALGFSMPIAWPAVADGVAQGTAPNRAFSDRFPMTVATWLLMLVAVIVWNPSMPLRPSFRLAPESTVILYCYGNGASKHRFRLSPE